MSHTTIEIKTEDGTCPSHVFTPDGAGPWPGVLFYIDGIGMRPAIREVGERLAKAGYYVLMPDLFYRAGAYTCPDPKQLFTDPAVGQAWFQKVFQHATPDKCMRDTKVFLELMATQKQVKPGKIGATGYCMGGRLALIAAATYPDKFAAVAAYHPGGLVTDTPDSPHLLASKIKARVYVGGAKDDQNFSDDARHKLDEALTKAGVDHVVEKYDAMHGWVPSDTPVHDKAATEKHWQTLLGLFQRSLS
jgi:carboxymethylenebutenolidase